MVNRAVSVIVLQAAIFSFAQTTPRTARDYFVELRDAKQLNRYADTFVCFAENDVPSFAVISRGSDIIDEMKKAGVTPDKTVLQAKDLLVVETYYKGVSNKTEIFSPVGSDGTEWDLEFASPFHGRMLYSINWATGRYRLSIYILDRSKATPAEQRYGKCESIHVKQ
jgi:hypothetical protein